MRQNAALIGNGLMSHLKDFSLVILGASHGNRTHILKWPKIDVHKSPALESRLFGLAIMKSQA